MFGTTPEHQRLAEIRNDHQGWRKWGPYVSERSWATVREDYSSDGEAWRFLSYAAAAAKAYRWGEDGIAGICDRYQRLVFAPAFWNGRDPLLKERLFGVTPLEGNHGEDVKEYYFHLDNTPTHSYMRFLYKYPQQEFPYRRLVEENQARGGLGFEFELLDTDIFAEDRYFDIFIEYAKLDEDDICIRLEAINRGPAAAMLHILPQLWFRNTWSWTSPPRPEPVIRLRQSGADCLVLVADDSAAPAMVEAPACTLLGPRILYATPQGRPLFTDNETQATPIADRDGGERRKYAKDAFHRFVMHGEPCVNPELTGTKAAIDYHFAAVPAGGSAVLLLRLSDKTELVDPLSTVEPTICLRRAEADAFYDKIHPVDATADERLVQRQALSGLLWNKQFYMFDVQKWLEGDNPSSPPPRSRLAIRNQHWRHLNSLRVMAVPDKWEYPWFAAWDLAFQCIALAMVDPQYAKDQLWVLLFEQFQHPNGQIPAYEWEFSDLNPPVHAWAVWRVYNMARIRTGRADRDFLERCFHKLLLNFGWWINKVDRHGNNLFEGGFLGLDNITVVDRSRPCQDGAVLEQSDATGWMGMFCLSLMRIALELAKENRVYEGLAVKYFQHYVYIAAAMKNMGNRNYQLWDEEDGFFYDVLNYPDGRFQKFRVRSWVGLIPLFAVERLEREWIKPFPEFSDCLDWFLSRRSELSRNVVHTIDREGARTHLLTIVDRPQLVRILQRIWDPKEFLGDHGIRSLSQHHRRHPFQFDGRSVEYEPAEAISKLKGGNSNWRGPIWFPTCFLLIESLRKLGKALGEDFVVATPAFDQTPQSMRQLARDLADRLIGIFIRNAEGRRAVFGGTEKFQNDPHWRDLVLFFEYFQGDDGAGLGASHQAGWTALVASLIDEWR